MRRKHSYSTFGNRVAGRSMIVRRSGSVSPPFENLPKANLGMWSTFKERSDYSGACVRVVRAADLVEQDIGFAADGWVDMAAYSAFGTGTEKIVKIYDQSGNGWHFEAAAVNAPILQVSGLNSKPCFYFDGSVNSARMRVAGFTDWNGLADAQFISATANANSSNGHLFIGGLGGRMVEFSHATTDITAFGPTWSNSQYPYDDLGTGVVRRFVFDGGAASDALRARYFRNGMERTASVVGSIGTTLNNETHLDWNGTPLAGNSLTQEYFGFYYVGQDLTSQEAAAIDAALAARLYRTTQSKLTCEGDSLTIGYGSSDAAHAYPGQLHTLLTGGGSWTTRNLGVAAEGVTAILAQQKSTVLHYRDEWAANDIVCVWIGTNDIAIASGASSAARVDPILSSVSTYIQNLVNYGWDAASIYVLNILPRSDVDVTNANFEADRLYFNANIGSTLSGRATIVDVASIPELQDETDTVYYFDLVHLNDTGYGIVADAVYTAILPNLN